VLLGIDVGGTFTDAVIIASGRILASAKRQTTHHDLLEGILNVLDDILPAIDQSKLKRVALSTTIVTNALIEGRIEKVGLCLVPGPGFDTSKIIPAPAFILSGYIDHRGREVKKIEKSEIQDFCRRSADIDVYAVVGKFAVRNPKHETLMAEWIKDEAKPSHITIGSAVSGSLNFWRRTNSAYFNAAVWRQFSNFSAAVERALLQRKISAPVYILKADGGTMPLTAAKTLPVEAVFTGPAASVLGIMAMYNSDRPAVSVDIGGTTTDIALWENGKPLFSSRGAMIKGFPTSIRSLRLKSVGIGGDSFIWRENGELRVGPMRKGPAMAAGGNWPALSDAMIVAGLARFGDKNRALQAISQVALPGQSLTDAAWAVLNTAAEIVKKAINDMIDEQAAEPVYRVEDVIKAARFKPETLIGVGGAAGGLSPVIAKQFGIPCQVPNGAMVANAVGAAVARPTIDITLRADTAEGYYSVAELGVKQALANRRLSLSDAYQLAVKYLQERARQVGIDASDVEVVQQEEFNLVRGFNSTGKIISSRVQIKPGVLMPIDDSGAKGVLE
jgi:N-methylhydantoinase A/oxoprolinase/acetone carboxylase beta subunit